MYPSETADKFVVRLPDGMRDQLKAKAKANHRTMNSLIVHVLDRALAADENEGPAAALTAPGRDHTPTQPMDRGDDERI